MSVKMTRRSFLKKGSFVLALTAVPGMGSLLKVTDAMAADKNFKPNAYVEIATDGSITVWVGQTNLGQGTHTGFALIVAEELDADWKKVSSKMAWAAEAFKNPKLWNLQVTGGSTSIWHHHERFRKAGAAAREMLRQAAAQQWKTSASKMKTRDNKVIHPDGRTLDYGDLAGAAAKMPIPEKPYLKKPSEYRYIGTNPKRLDIPEKVDGSIKYGTDFTMPDMVTAVLAYPPRYNAKPESWNEKAAMAVKGVTNVVKVRDKIAVCAETTWAAMEGRDALDVRWSKGSHPDLNNEWLDKLFTKHLKTPKEKMMGHDHGDPAKGLAEAKHTRQADFKLPYISHAQVEPLNSTVLVEGDRVKIWIPTQGQTFTQIRVAGALGVPVENVELMTLPVGGGFGLRTFEDDTSVDAAFISREINRPVKVFMLREDCFAQEQFRPGIHSEIKAGVDENGKITGWSQKIASQSIMSQVGDKLGMKRGVDHFIIEGISDTCYDIENREVHYSEVDLPIPLTFWRSVGMSTNIFTVEVMMDKLARAAGKDPLQFRLDNLPKGSRTHDVLSFMAEKHHWQGTKVSNGHFRGVATGYFFNSSIAHMVEVSVAKDGSIKIHKVVGAIDCGEVIYPDQVQAQIDGGIIMGLSTALYESVDFVDGGVSTSNYSDYPILSMSEIPEIEVDIRKSAHSIGGIGETVYPTVAPALCNAIYQATGVAITELPINTQLLANA